MIFGVDLRDSSKRPSPVVGLNGESKLSFLKTLAKTQSYWKWDRSIGRA